MGRRVVREQSVGRAGVPFTGSGAGLACARGLPDEPAAHLRRYLPSQFLRQGSARITRRALLNGLAGGVGATALIQPSSSAGHQALESEAGGASPGALQA